MNSNSAHALLPFLDQPARYLPVVEGLLRGGFPSPADDFSMGQLDLIELLVKHPLVTFCWQVTGFSMKNAGISDGDFLVVDKSLRPRHGDIVVAEVDGETPPRSVCEVPSVDRYTSRPLRSAAHRSAPR